jgi:serine/threonine protein kinase
MKYNSNMFQIPKEVRGFNLEFLFYDYLSKLSLIDYIDKVNEQIKEIHVQYLCYILLKAIEKMRSINICHNKIDISNIMFDDDFNPKLIHFSEAKILYSNI